MCRKLCEEVIVEAPSVRGMCTEMLLKPGKPAIQWWDQNKLDNSKAGLILQVNGYWFNGVLNVHCNIITLRMYLYRGRVEYTM